ncbi:MAG: hypothetical protein JSW11_11130 [Candidatus Heimdallarchaeota archaeon]|nr:MAG: hypothetical protein JSW11_11130 [Candidatus Heimdallarchaeota archaeon]
MNTAIKKALIIGTPFSVLIVSICIATILTRDISSPLDEDWITRQFLIGMFMFAGLSIIPRLLHFQFSFSGLFPSCRIDLNHHPPPLQVDHEFQLGEHSICSGCVGSFLSIVFAELLFLMYFLYPNWFSNNSFITFLLIGIVLILISYSRYFFVLKPNIRLIQHVTLFIGVVFAIIGSDLYLQSAFSMILLLPSWLLFLIGRVKLGEIDHVAVE